MPDVIFTPSDLVALVNQTLEFAYPSVTVEGELSDFRVSKSRWVYFDLKDNYSKVSFFGAVEQLPGPLEDGLMVRATGRPRLHARFGFSINVISMAPVGEGSLRKAALLLKLKLQAEGLFEPERKRPLPAFPESIGLITAIGSAAYADFVGILSKRWGGTRVLVADVYVQGDKAPGSIVKALEYFNRFEIPEVVVITRGGGGAEDLAAFNDERLVRAVAVSPVPTLVAIGHETDESLAELAADVRANTPTSAAALVVPDRKVELSLLKSRRDALTETIAVFYLAAANSIGENRQKLTDIISGLLDRQKFELKARRQLLALLNPRAALKRGYAIVQKSRKLVKSVSHISVGDHLELILSDGTIGSHVERVSKNV